VVVVPVVIRNLHLFRNIQLVHHFIYFYCFLHYHVVATYFFFVIDLSSCHYIFVWSSSFRFLFINFLFLYFVLLVTWGRVLAKVSDAFGVHWIKQCAIFVVFFPGITLLSYIASYANISGV